MYVLRLKNINRKNKYPFKTPMTLTHLWNTNEDIFLSSFSHHFCPSIEGLCNPHFQASKRLKSVYGCIKKLWESYGQKMEKECLLHSDIPVRFIDTVNYKRLGYLQAL